MIIEADNKKVFASDAGKIFEKDEHTRILLHGSGLSHIVWSLTEQYLSNKGYNILAIDLPGHGNSEGPSLSSIEDIAEWLKKVINRIGIQDLTILGHSQGCLEAIEYASRYPNKVKNLILVGGSYKIPVNKELIDLASAGDKDAINLMMKWG